MSPGSKDCADCGHLKNGVQAQSASPASETHGGRTSTKTCFSKAPPPRRAQGAFGADGSAGAAGHQPSGCAPLPQRCFPLVSSQMRLFLTVYRTDQLPTSRPPAPCSRTFCNLLTSLHDSEVPHPRLPSERVELFRGSDTCSRSPSTRDVLTPQSAGVSRGLT